MKYLIIIPILTAFLLAKPASPCKAQSTKDLITELILDMRKLTALRGILDDMYRGYQILDQGYTAINDLSEGNYELHRQFLDGLLLVAEPVLQDWHIGDIFRSIQSMTSKAAAALSRFRTSGRLSADELDYAAATHAGCTSADAAALDELSLVTTSGALRMSDAERLQTIARIHAGIGARDAALQHFDQMADLLIIQRARDQRDITTLKLLYGIQQ